MQADLPRGDAQGLTPAEVESRRLRYGRNEVPGREGRDMLRTVRGVFTEPMFVLLIVAAGLYLAMGDRGEGLLLLFFAVVTVGLVIVQERRSQRALDALRRLAVPQVRVIRGGATTRVAGAELVPGDLFLLDEGERVPADGVVRAGDALSVDESLLTGESIPVRKAIALEGAAAAPDRPDMADGDDGSGVFAGTLVVSGHAIVEVLSTGAHTRMGRIGASLVDIHTQEAPLQQQLHRVVRVFAVGAVATSLALVAWYGLVRHDWMQGLLAGIALAMAMLPEEFPMALSVFLGLGAWRLARVKVLARQPAAIDSLGATTVLCLDKTGTLTANRLRLARLEAHGQQWDCQPGVPAPGALAELVDVAAAASRRGNADPLDQAVLAVAATASPTGSAAGQLVREYPLSAQSTAMGQAWSDGDRGCRIAAKGSPEAIAQLCRLDAPATEALRGRVATMAGQGLRVIGVARAAAAAAPDRLADAAFSFEGLLGFEDPLRPEVPAAIARARRAGIAVAMITGDHAATALAIAGKAGIATAAGALEGAGVAAMDDAALARAVRDTRVFARVMPSQKLRIVQALQAGGEIVAMTGDGVNDAPALKAAHVGIAMGSRGTDVAREAAQVVLLDDDVGRILDGVALGRRIFDNLGKVMVYITAIHVPIAGAALLPLLFGLPPLLLPVHVVLTEMVIDPMCSIAFESAPPEPDVMDRAPRPAGRNLLDLRVFARGLGQGAVLLVTVLAVYAGALHAGRDVDVARALGIVALTVGNIALVAVDTRTAAGWRSLVRRDFASFWILAGLACAVLAVGLALPAARELLHFGRPAPADLAGVLGAVVVVACAMAWWRRLAHRGRLRVTMSGTGA